MQAFLVAKKIIVCLIYLKKLGQSLGRIFLIVYFEGLTFFIKEGVSGTICLSILFIFHLHLLNEM
jgi:hypothetical protein